MRQVSFEIPNVAEAEPVPFGEGSMSTIAMRDGGVPSESRVLPSSSVFARGDLIGVFTQPDGEGPAAMPFHAGRR